MAFKSRRPRQGETILLTGWLFADLFLALAVIFLSANTSGVAVRPTPTPAPTVIPTATSIPTATVAPQPTATPIPQPRLELQAHRVTLTNVDTDGLLSDTPSAISDLQNRIRSQGFLRGRTVGLVIVYVGAKDDTLIARAQNAAKKVMAALRDLGHTGFAFERSSYYDPLYTLGDDGTTVVIDIYLFA